MAHKILVTAQRPNSPFPFGSDWDWDWNLAWGLSNTEELTADTKNEAHLDLHDPGPGPVQEELEVAAGLGVAAVTPVPDGSHDDTNCDN